ncbi:MAG: DUF4349 domain-containing protein [Acidobacteria bacterium]|nr:DUF4349 domain-containing protein [Acidobacteriota bacterium]
MKSASISLFVCFCLLVTSCSRASQNAPVSTNVASGDYRLGEPTLQADSDGLTGGSKVIATKATAQPEQVKEQSTQISEPQPTDRKIIRNGEFTIESKNPTEDQRKIQAIAESFGGFVVTSEFQQSTAYVSTVSVIVRVPSAQFQAATDKIRGVGSQVLREKISGKDVTEEYVDLEAQLRAKKALEAQFLEIMKQARKVEDALSVQEKLSEVRTEIERLEGRRRYLDNQATLSTINVGLQTPAPLVAATQTGFWASVKNSFGDGVDVAVSIVLGFIHFVIVMLPVFVLILLPVGLLLRYCWRRFGWQRFFKKEPRVEAEA